MKTIVSRIQERQLPLSEGNLYKVRDFCGKKQKDGRLAIIGGLPDMLRADWLNPNPSISNLVKASGHHLVSADAWRMELMRQCKLAILKYKLKHKRDYNCTLSILMWRGALAFAPFLHEEQVRMGHMDVKRNEHQSGVNVLMRLHQQHVRVIQFGHFSRILIPDVMLATGSSTHYIITMLKAMKVPEDKITVLSIMAAPEGVYALLKTFPGINIITMSLEERLNEHAYIVPGCGDAGDKLFSRIKAGVLGEFSRSLLQEELSHFATLVPA